jgi:hypothetical protein
MKRAGLSILIASLVLFGLVANICAYTFYDTSGNWGTEGLYGTWSDAFYGYTDDDWSGYYLGTFPGNDFPNLFRNEANDYLTLLDTGSFPTEGPTVDFNGTWARVEGTSGTDEFLTTTSGAVSLSGTWSLADPYVLGFYVVMAGAQHALYYVDPYESSGDWSTFHIEVGNGQQPTISHLSVLAVEGSTPVPEPATMLLLGSGLVGISSIGMRRKLKK